MSKVVPSCKLIGSTCTKRQEAYSGSKCETNTARLSARSAWTLTLPTEKQRIQCLQ